MSNLEMFKYEWVWEKNRASNPMLSKKQPLKFHENILVFSKNTSKYIPQMNNIKIRDNRKYFSTKKIILDRLNSNFTIEAKKDTGIRFPKSILKITQEHFSKIVHPTQKPVALFEYLIKTYTNKGDIVLDNCIGSGTTAVACVHLKRHYIGFETSKKYCRIAKARLEAEKTLWG